MQIPFRVPTADDVSTLAAFDGRAFGSDWKPEDLERTVPTLPLHRFLMAEDEGQIVAAGGAYEMELTLPGGQAIDAAGVTWIAVAVTHRRQGLLRDLIGRLHATAAEHDEPVLMLTASEGAIYRRFGYGVATRWRSVVIDSPNAVLDESLRPAPGEVRIVDREGLDDQLVERWDRCRRNQPGEISRDAAWFHAHLPKGDRATFVLHDDGYAAWTIDPEWDNGHPKHRLTIRDFCAATPAAHAALWFTILSVDLVGPIRTGAALTPDDALPHLLSNPRALRTKDLTDHLWVAVRDVPAAFSARSYRTDDHLILGTPTGSFAVDPDGCTPTTDDPDLVCEADALGPLLLGGVSASELARGQRVSAERGVLSRADAFFGNDPVAHCRTSF